MKGEKMDNIETLMKGILNEFVEFIIKETCQGCMMCNPGINDKGIVCLHQGEAVWYRSEVEEFLKYKEDHPDE